MIFFLPSNARLAPPCEFISTDSMVRQGAANLRCMADDDVEYTRAFRRESDEPEPASIATRSVEQLCTPPTPIHG